MNIDIPPDVGDLFLDEFLADGDGERQINELFRDLLQEDDLPSAVVGEAAGQADSGQVLPLPTPTPEEGIPTHAVTTSFCQEGPGCSFSAVQDPSALPINIRAFSAGVHGAPGSEQYTNMTHVQLPDLAAANALSSLYPHQLRSQHPELHTDLEQMLQQQPALCLGAPYLPAVRPPAADEPGSNGSRPSGISWTSTNGAAAAVYPLLPLPQQQQKLQQYQPYTEGMNPHGGYSLPVCYSAHTSLEPVTQAPLHLAASAPAAATAPAAGGAGTASWSAQLFLPRPEPLPPPSSRRSTAQSAFLDVPYGQQHPPPAFQPVNGATTDRVFLGRALLALCLGCGHWTDETWNARDGELLPTLEAVHIHACLPHEQFQRMFRATPPTAAAASGAAAGAAAAAMAPSLAGGTSAGVPGSVPTMPIIFVGPQQLLGLKHLTPTGGFTKSKFHLLGMDADLQQALNGPFLSSELDTCARAHAYEHAIARAAALPAGANGSARTVPAVPFEVGGWYLCDCESMTHCLWHHDIKANKCHREGHPTHTVRKLFLMKCVRAGPAAAAGAPVAGLGCCGLPEGQVQQLADAVEAEMEDDEQGVQLEGLRPGRSQGARRGVRSRKAVGNDNQAKLYEIEVTVASSGRKEKGRMQYDYSWPAWYEVLAPKQEGRRRCPAANYAAAEPSGGTAARPGPTSAQEPGAGLAVPSLIGAAALFAAVKRASQPATFMAASSQTDAAAAVAAAEAILEAADAALAALAAAGGLTGQLQQHGAPAPSAVAPGPGRSVMMQADHPTASATTPNATASSGSAGLAESRQAAAAAAGSAACGVAVPNSAGACAVGLPASEARYGEGRIHSPVDGGLRRVRHERDEQECQEPRRGGAGRTSQGGIEPEPGSAQARSDAACAKRLIVMSLSANVTLSFWRVFLKEEVSFNAGRLLAIRDGDADGFGVLNLVLTEAVKQLGAVAGRAEPADPTSEPEKALFVALQERVVGMLRLLVEEWPEQQPVGGDGGLLRGHRRAGEVLLLKLLLQKDRHSMDTPLHTCCRHGLLCVLDWLLGRCTPEVLVATTKDGWLPLHTACRCGHQQAAVALLRRADQFGLFQAGGSSQAMQVLLSDLTPFNRHYRENRGLEVLQRALEQVWPYPCQRPPVFTGVQELETHLEKARSLESQMQGLGLGQG